MPLPAARVHLHNITDVDVQTGKEEYLKFGAGSLKKKTALTPKNVFEKAALFRELHMASHGQAVSFQQLLLEMMRTGMYHPAGSWITPWAGKGMSHARATAMWRMISDPANVQAADVHQ